MKAVLAITKSVVAKTAGDFVGGAMLNRVSMCAVLLGALTCLAGCGSDAGDRLVLSFVGFTAGDVEQADGVFDTHAEVDVCGFVCIKEEEVTVEPFTQTTATAVFMNYGKADIRLDQYTLYVPGSGIEQITRPISTIIPGGRCVSNPSLSCAVDAECGASGRCVHSETRVTFLLYDFDFKDRVLLGRCPSLAYDDSGFVTVQDPDAVIHQELTALLTFSGVDDRNERYTVTAAYPSSFDNFDACEAQG